LSIGDEVIIEDEIKSDLDWMINTAKMSLAEIQEFYATRGIQLNFATDENGKTIVDKAIYAGSFSNY
jgi:hypothetical protein